MSRHSPAERITSAVTSYTFEPFDESHLDEAAALLAARHARDRKERPMLPTRFETTGDAREALIACWERPGAQGVVARTLGRMDGFLIGARDADVARGRSKWVRLAGHALHEEADPDLYRDLYAHVASEWLADGCFTHRAQLPAADYPAMDAWFHLTFGLEHIHGLCDLSRLDDLEQHETPRGIEIRQATEDDIPGILDISDVIARHQASAPSFAPMTPETPEALREGYSEFLDEDDVTAWVAVDAGTVVSFQIFHPMPTQGLDLHIPAQCVELVVAATDPEMRGQGIAGALTLAGLRWAREAGNAWCEADWRASNLQSSHFWPRFGFEPVILRMSRTIDERAAWARGES